MPTQDNTNLDAGQQGPASQTPNFDLSKPASDSVPQNDVSQPTQTPVNPYQENQQSGPYLTNEPIANSTSPEPNHMQYNGGQINNGSGFNLKLILIIAGSVLLLGLLIGGSILIFGGNKENNSVTTESEDSQEQSSAESDNSSTAEETTPSEDEAADGEEEEEEADKPEPAASSTAPTTPAPPATLPAPVETKPTEAPKPAPLVPDENGSVGGTG